MEIPELPLDKIDDQIIKDFLVDSCPKDEDQNEWTNQSFAAIADNPMGLYWKAFFIAYWIYHTRNLKKVFTGEVIESLGAEIDKNINEVKNRSDQSSIEAERKKWQILAADLERIRDRFNNGEFAWPKNVEKFMKGVAKKELNERNIYQTEDEVIRSYLRFRIAFNKGIGAFDLEPDEITEQTNKPYGEGHNF